MKRAAVDIGPSRDLSRARKRTKLSAGADKDSDSSIPSSGSVSEDSALQSSPSRSERTRRSSHSSLRSSLTDNGSESRVSSSSDDGSSASDTDSDDGITTLGGPKKPDMSSQAMSDGANDLRSRLADLLPQLAESNDILASENSRHNMEDVDEDEQHIEMNLSLGVLEHKNADDRNSNDLSSNETSDCQDDVSGGENVDGTIHNKAKGKVSNVMDKLMGRRGAAQQAQIEEVG